MRQTSTVLQPPISPWIKLNMDGVSKGNPGPSGGVGAFRSPSGQWMRGFVFRCETCLAFRAELWALFHGLRLLLLWVLAILFLKLIVWIYADFC